MGFKERRRGCTLPGIVLVALAVFLTTPALAGPHGALAGPFPAPSGFTSDLTPTHGTSAQHPASDARNAGFALAIVIAALLRLGRVIGRPGRLAAFALGFVLSAVSVETAVHSVHHMSDPRSAASCPVLSGSQHVPGALTAHADVWALRLIVARPLAVVPDTIPPDRFARPDEGRAPPASPSA